MRLKSLLLVLFIVLCNVLQAQTMYELAYYFDINNTKEVHQAFLYCNADGTGFVRVRYVEKNNTERVVNMDLKQEYEKDQNREQSKMFFTGINSNIISPDSLSGNTNFIADRFLFTIDPQSGFFEPSEVSMAKNGQEYIAVLTKTKFIETPDLTPGFVLQYFKEDDVFYNNLFPRKSRGPGNTTKGVRLHFISITNTMDKDIGPTCVLDKKNTLKIFSSIAETLKIPMDSTQITGMDFNKKNLFKAIDTITAGDNDIIVFYYSGHGYSKKNNPNLFPFLDLRINPTTPPLPGKEEVNIDSIYTLIKAKKGKVKLVLSDCCNYGETMKSIIAPNLAGIRGGPVRLSPAYCQELFINPEKPVSYLMTAASKGEVSAGTNAQGGFFTSQFKASLEKYAGIGNTDTFSWADIVSDAQTLTKTTAGGASCPLPENNKVYKPCKQTPMFKKN